MNDVRHRRADAARVATTVGSSGVHGRPDGERPASAAPSLQARWTSPAHMACAVTTDRFGRHNGCAVREIDASRTCRGGN